MMDKLDFSRSFRGPAWALAGVCCVGLLSLGTTNCLPAPADDTGGSGGGGSTFSGGDGGNSSSGNPSGGSNNSGGSNDNGGTTSNGGNYSAGGTTSKGGNNSAGGTTSKGGSNNAGGNNSAGGTTSKGGSNNSGGSQSSGGTTTSSSGGIGSSGGVTSLGGVTTAGGVTSPGGSTATGTTVTFSSGKGVGAMVGYGWVALGSADTISDPTCGASKAPITAAAPCAADPNWSSTTALCMTGSIPALGSTPDYAANFGVVVGVNATDPATGGLGQTFTSVTITATGGPGSGVRAQIHKKGDPDSSSYCFPFTSGTAMALAKFAIDCYNTTPLQVYPAADIPNIDKISLEVFSATAAITVASLCITGISFQ